MHELLKEAYGLSAGSGLFVFATVEEQPIIAFFKLNYQSRLTCEKTDDGKVVWRKDVRLLPMHTQKEYDYFYMLIMTFMISRKVILTFIVKDLKHIL